MKTTFTFLLVLFVFGITNTFAQGNPDRQNGVPVKPTNPVLYATDVIIEDDASQDQRGTNLSIAFNGWAYEVHTLTQGTEAGYNIYKSVDDGESWTLLNGNVFENYTNLAVDLVVCGSSTADLRLFQAGIAYFPSTGLYVVYVDKYDATTGNFLGEIFYESSSYKIYDVKIVSDYKFPSVGAGPYSLGLLFSRYGAAADTLVFISSPDAGQTFGNRKVVKTTGYYMDKISLSHGSSGLWFNGRYFAAWEERPFNARVGRTFVSNSDPYFYSDWVTPTRLDDIAGSSTDQTKNPVISCQENLYDNDASNFTTIVLLDRDYWGDGLDYDVIGMYNKNSAGGSGTWTRFDISNDGYNVFEADASFDPGFNNFLVTYCDSTNQKLPYVVKYQDLVDPNSWLMINSAYNMYPNLVNPFPKVEINPVYTQVGHVWTGTRPGGFGMATWDAEYSTVGVPPAGQNAGALALKVYPNPCSTKATLEFTLDDAADVTIDLVTAYGQKVRVITDDNLSAGRHTVPIDVSGLPGGCYYYTFSNGNSSVSGKIVVTH
jgi:hypothetical protein